LTTNITPTLTPRAEFATEPYDRGNPRHHHPIGACSSGETEKRKASRDQAGADRVPPAHGITDADADGPVACSVR